MPTFCAWRGQVSGSVRVSRDGQRGGVAAFVPTRSDVDDLRVGDQAFDCFGKIRKVVRITYRGADINGRAYVGFYTEFGTDGGSISHSYKEGELVRTVALSNVFTSAECDEIEALVARL